MMNKIIIGSANFDQKYGIKKNFIGKKEIKTLLNIASKNVSLDDKFVMEHCPKISRGIEALIDWLNQR